MSSLTIVRQIKARPSFVFEAMTTPDGIAEWWCPDDGPVLVAEVDPRVGGRFRVRFRTTDGVEHECHGAFLQMVPNEHFAMSWRWMGGQEDPGESHVDVAFRPIQEGTEICVTHSRLDNEETRQRHEDGWNGSLGKLELYCTRQ